MSLINIVRLRMVISSIFVLRPSQMLLWQQQGCFCVLWEVKNLLSDCLSSLSWMTVICVSVRLSVQQLY